MSKRIFGKAPSGERLERMVLSPQFRNGKFFNLTETPELAEGYTMPGLVYKQVFKKTPRRRPADPIPSIKQDLHSFKKDEDILIWFGHSSYYMQLNGLRVLVDPVMSGNASPVAGTNKSFPGTDIYQPEDIPDIDYLIISHDHYDHLDYKTILKLKSKTRKVICGLGVGAHFEFWGYDPQRIIEGDWYDTIQPEPGLTITVLPARHFSGRGLSRNNTLWCSYLWDMPGIKLYIGGDSGYDDFFETIGAKYGPFDFAILDNGQYDDAWPYIHMHPPDVLKAATALRTKRLMPVHSSKFVMANHAWDEPLIRITELNREANLPLVTPMIGETVFIKSPDQVFKSWWQEVQ